MDISKTSKFCTSCSAVAYGYIVGTVGLNGMDTLEKKANAVLAVARNPIQNFWRPDGAQKAQTKRKEEA